MKKGKKSSLADYVDEPSELTGYFEEVAKGTYSNIDDAEVNLLPIDEALQLTKEFRSFNPMVELLGGVVLDYPNTSDHHVYLTKGPCNGSILFLRHDDESRLVFPSLAKFMVAVHKAKKSKESLTDFHPEDALQLKKQRELSALIIELYENLDDFDSTATIVALIQSMDLSDVELLQTLAEDDLDFFIPEAVANQIAKRPRAELLDVAKACKKQKHSQAKSAGKRAIAAIEALK